DADAARPAGDVEALSAVGVDELKAARRRGLRLPRLARRGLTGRLHDRGAVGRRGGAHGEALLRVLRDELVAGAGALEREALVIRGSDLARPRDRAGAVGRGFARDVGAHPAGDGDDARGLRGADEGVVERPELVVSALARPLDDLRARRRARPGDVQA